MLLRRGSIRVLDYDVLLLIRRLDDNFTKFSYDSSNCVQRSHRQQPWILTIICSRLHGCSFPDPPIRAWLSQQSFHADPYCGTGHRPFYSLYSPSKLSIIQILILFLQHKLGPRFFIPKIFQPDYYNYNFKIRSS